MTARVRGLHLAVWTSPPVAGELPLLLVNGGMINDHSLLWPALSPLAARRQLVLYDQRGRGESQPPADPLAARIEDDAEDIGALRRALGIRRWDVLGHSWGGGIAMLGVARDLAATRRLVTVDAVGPTSAWMPLLHAGALERVDAASRAALERLWGGALRDPDPAVHREHAQAMYRSWFADQAMAEYFTAPAVSNVTGAAALARLRGEGYDWSPVLRALSTPALVVHGERDPLPLSVALELAALLPQASAVILPDAGHMPFWEAPIPFFTAVDDFLTGSTGR